MIIVSNFRKTSQWRGSRDMLEEAKKNLEKTPTIKNDFDVIKSEEKAVDNNIKITVETPELVFNKEKYK